MLPLRVREDAPAEPQAGNAGREGATEPVAMDLELAQRVPAANAPRQCARQPCTDQPQGSQLVELADLGGDGAGEARGRKGDVLERRCTAELRGQRARQKNVIEL